MSQRAIGVFDSGVGGLTVLREIRRRFPAEKLIYLGDTARVPYGSKSAETVCRYALEAADFMASQGVKMLIVACNTASSAALHLLQERLDIPVVGVIEPGARKGVSVTRNRRIGVIGTEGTVRSQAYPRAIHALAPDAEVFSAACPLFVPLAEEGWGEHQVALLAAREYLTPLMDKGIDTLVLGCTHYPLLKKTLAAVLGPDVTLVDSGEETARRVAAILAGQKLQGTGVACPPRFFVTDVPARFERVGGAFLGGSLGPVAKVDIDGSVVPKPCDSGGELEAML